LAGAVAIEIAIQKIAQTGIAAQVGVIAEVGGIQSVE
jgi:hypothetical protein